MIVPIICNVSHLDWSSLQSILLRRGRMLLAG